LLPLLPQLCCSGLGSKFLPGAGGGGAQVGPLRLCVHPRRQTAPPPCGCGPVQIRARTGTAWRAGHLRRGKKYTIVVTVWGCPCTRADMADDRALHCTALHAESQIPFRLSFPDGGTREETAVPHQQPGRVATTTSRQIPSYSPATSRPALPAASRTLAFRLPPAILKRPASPCFQ
jgi:hypothetical protein